jgi:peptidoglycan hydrolase CwlO-like protein
MTTELHERIHFLFWNCVELIELLKALRKLKGIHDSPTRFERRWKDQFQTYADQLRPQTPEPTEKDESPVETPRSTEPTIIQPTPLEFPPPTTVHFPLRGESLPLDQPRAFKRIPRAKRIPPASFSDDYEYYDDDEPRPINPKRGFVRPSETDPLFEYEYYDDEGDPERLFEKFDVNDDDIPARVVVAKLRRKPRPAPEVVARYPKPEKPASRVIGKFPPADDSETVIPMRNLDRNEYKTVPKFTHPPFEVIQKQPADPPAEARNAEIPDEPPTDPELWERKPVHSDRRLPAAVFNAKDFRRVRTAEELAASGPRRRTINARGHEYEYDYEYSYDEEERTDAPADTRRAGTAFSLVIGEFPLLAGRPPEDAQESQESEEPEEPKEPKEPKGPKEPTTPKGRNGRSSVRRKGRSELGKERAPPPDPEVDSDPVLARIREEGPGAPNDILRTFIAEVEAAILTETQRRDALNCELALLLERPETNFETANVAAFLIENPPDPPDYSNFRGATVQTDVSDETIEAQLGFIASHQKEVAEVAALQERERKAQVEIRGLEAEIRTTEEEAETQNTRIAELRVQLEEVRDDLEKEDAKALEEDKVSAVHEEALGKLDQAAGERRVKHEKIAGQLSALIAHLQSLLELKVVLETELSDIYDREKPEVRQLLREVQDCKQTIEETNTRIASIQKRMDTNKQVLQRLNASTDAIDRRIQQLKFQRRRTKWQLILGSSETHQDIESFSQKMAGSRETLKRSVSEKERDLVKRTDEVAALAAYERLLQAMVGENKDSV